MDNMTTKQRCIVVGVGKPYSFIPDGEKEPLTGCKMVYLATDDIKKTRIDEESGTLGYMPQKYTMPPSFYDSIKTIPLPCLADITFEIKFETGGTKVSITDVSFVVADKK